MLSILHIKTKWASRDGMSNSPVVWCGSEAHQELPVLMPSLGSTTIASYSCDVPKLWKKSC